MITDQQYEQLCFISEQIESQEQFLFVIHRGDEDSPDEVGVDVLEYWNEDEIDGGWMSFDEAVDFINSHHEDEHEEEEF